MRTFWAALLLVCVLLVCVVLHYVYINRLLDEMEALALAMPDASPTPENAVVFANAASLPCDLWEKNMPLLSCTVQNKYLTAISNAALTAKEASLAADAGSYRTARAALLSAIENLRETESVSFLGIF